MRRVDDRGRTHAAETLAREAVEWMLETSAAGGPDVSLYRGLSGVMLALVEAADHFEEP